MSVLLDLAGHQLQDLLEKEEISHLELFQTYWARLQSVEPQLKALLTTMEREAKAQAEKLDEQRRGGAVTAPLAGIPLVLADNLCTEGVQTTCASRMLQDFRPPYEATLVGKLRQAGALFMGKSNLAEFDLGLTTEDSAFFATHLPDSSEVACSGAVAALLGREAVGAISNASLNTAGLFGLKPTAGLLSRYGVITATSSLKRLGCLTRNLTDCALILQTICGFDQRDSLSLKRPVLDYRSFLKKDLKGLRIGIWGEITPVLKEISEKLQGEGAICQTVSLAYEQVLLPVYQVLVAAEASSNLARFDGVRYGLRVEAPDLETLYRKTRSQGWGKVVKQQIIEGTYFLSAQQYETYYLKALKLRALIKEEMAQLWGKYDCLLTSLAQTAECPGRILADLTGEPALALPWGSVVALAPFCGEEVLFKVGASLERSYQEGGASHGD